MGSAKALAALLTLLGGWRLFGLDVPSELVFGTLFDDAVIQRSFTMTNTASSSVMITTLVTCSCLSVVPSSFTLAPGATARVWVLFDPKGNQEEVRNAVLVRIRGGENADRIVAVKATVISRTSPASDGGCVICRDLEEQFREAVSAHSSRPRISMRYYFSADCRTCTAFLRSEIPRLERTLGMEITMELRDIAEDVCVREIERALAGRGILLTAFPVIAGNGIMLQGEKEIRERLASTLLSTTSSRRQ